ncbi:hypothetical protein BDF21DRAFT_409586 [Thamnidium elegans]|nr:hypothetical protein BDF21DRAFT_409586 [Thamnidium elegans]
MDKVYDFHRHSACALIYMNETDIDIEIISTSIRSSITRIDHLSMETCIVYCKQRQIVLSWGDPEFDKENNDHIRINNFGDILHQISQKDEDMRNEEDVFLLKAVSDFISLAINKLVKNSKKEIKGTDELHYSFITPSEWKDKIREDLIRQIFIRTKLVLESDHKDRVLFFSTIEAICYYIQNSSGNDCSFKRGQNTIMCRLYNIKANEVLIKFDSIQTVNSLFDFPESKFFPKVINSNSISITSQDIKDCIKLFLKNKLFPVIGNQSYLKRFVKERLVSVYEDWIIESIAQEIYNGDLSDMDTYDEHDRLVAPNTDTGRWTLNETQKSIFKSLGSFEMFTELGKSLLCNMKTILSNNFIKEYKLFLIETINSKVKVNILLLKWIKCMLEHNTILLNSTFSLIKLDSSEMRVSLNNIMFGAGFCVFESIKNSDIYCKPRILPTEDTIPSSVFLNSRPHIIFSIDISLQSTLLTCSVLNENGVIKEILNHNHFTADKCLPSLGLFYNISDETILTVNEQFIVFAEKFLLDDLNSFPLIGDTVMKEKFISKIEAILAIDSSTEETLIPTTQQTYIKAFIQMYMTYIKEIISSKLPVESDSDSIYTNIGFAISIEKRLLNNVIGTKQDFQELVSASKLVDKDSSTNKLRILTQGEGYLPVIQKRLKLKFPIRSFVLLSQLHEDYVQLTLNEVVTESSEEEGQQVVIILEKIINIQNIYKALCLNIWNSIIVDNSLIQPCDKHDGVEVSELLSVKSKTVFLDNLKKNLLNNIFKESSIKNTTEKSIQLNNFCDCKVVLTAHDIIDIALKPVLQDIVCIVSTSLLSKDFFGHYTDLQHLFNLIHFNTNTQLKDILASIIKEEFDRFTIEQGFDTCFWTLQELPSEILRPVLEQRHAWYKGFQIGILHQVFSGNYAVTFNSPDKKLLYKSKRTDKNGTVLESYTAVLLMKKGDRIGDGQLNKTCYLELQNISGFEFLYVHIHKFKTFDDLNCNGSLNSKADESELLCSFSIELRRTEIKVGNVLPVMICMVPQYYSSSLRLTIRLVGKNTKNNRPAETGEPMTVCLF